MYSWERSSGIGATRRGRRDYDDFDELEDYETEEEEVGLGIRFLGEDGEELEEADLLDEDADEDEIEGLA